jgi:hypothetical protein
MVQVGRVQDILSGLIAGSVERASFALSSRRCNLSGCACDDGIKILSRYTRMSDMKVLAQTYDYHSRMIWPRVPEIQPEDLKLVLEELAEANPKAREIDPAELIYGSVVKDVVASGLVERLYGR